jgi:hypothetical protein
MVDSSFLDELEQAGFIETLYKQIPGGSAH